jgi:hypothetical protein
MQELVDDTVVLSRAKSTRQLFEEHRGGKDGKAK